MKEIKFVYADDEEPLHLVTELTLKRAFTNQNQSVSVAHVYNGQQLVDYVKANPVEGVITDVDMPSKSGLVALLELQSLGNAPRSLVVTGRPTPERIAQIKETSSEYLLKPYSMTDIIAKLHAIWPEYAPQPQAGTGDGSFPRSH